jgi:chromosome partitioning protein
MARDITKHVDKVFGDRVFKTTIGKNVRLEESPAYKETIFTFAPDSSGAVEYDRLAREVLNRVR